MTSSRFLHTESTEYTDFLIYQQEFILNDTEAHTQACAGRPDGDSKH